MLNPASCCSLLGSRLTIAAASNLNNEFCTRGWFCAPGTKTLLHVFAWLWWTKSPVMQQVNSASLDRLAVPWTRECALFLLLVTRFCWVTFIQLALAMGTRWSSWIYRSPFFVSWSAACRLHVRMCLGQRVLSPWPNFSWHVSRGVRTGIGWCHGQPRGKPW